MGEMVKKLMEAMGPVADVANDLRKRDPKTAEQVDKIHDGLLRAIPRVRKIERAFSSEPPTED